MKILGIDYGRKKIGLAVSEGILAEPYSVVRYEEISEAFKKIKKILIDLKIEKVVIGVSEGQMGRETKHFGESLSEFCRVNPVYWDETLSSVDAIRLSAEAGVKREKRRQLEDAFAASLMLQSYLEANHV